MAHKLKNKVLIDTTGRIDTILLGEPDLYETLRLKVMRELE